MEHSDSIIIYRNPMEKQFFEGNGGRTPSLMIVFVITMGLVFLAVYKLLEQVFKTKYGYVSQPNWYLWVSGVVSCGAAIFACKFLNLF